MQLGPPLKNMQAVAPPEPIMNGSSKARAFGFGLYGCHGFRDEGFRDVRELGEVQGVDVSG